MNIDPHSFKQDIAAWAAVVTALIVWIKGIVTELIKAITACTEVAIRSALKIRKLWSNFTKL
jgi:hypothetical protein